MRKYIEPWRRGGKVTVMSDIEAQALLLFRQLTHEQKQAFIHHVLPQSLQAQKEPLSGVQETAPGTDE